MATLQEIKDIATLVKNATVAGENTAERVGGLFEKIAQILQQHDSSIGEKGDNEALETVKSTADAAKLKAEQAQGAADNAQSAVDALKKSFETLVSSNTSVAIDNYNEIIKFLDGLKDSDNLSSILTKLNSALSSTTSIANANKQDLANAVSRIDSLSTSVDEKVNTLKADVDEKVNSVPQFLSMSESQYDALEEKDENTYYMLTEE